MLASAMTNHQPQASTDPLADFLAALFGRAESGQVEVRYRRVGDDQMLQRYYRPGALIRAAATLRQLSHRHDVWVGIAPRTRRAGDLSAVAPTWAVWVDCDGDTTALDAFSVEPSMRVASGSGPGHVHAYWLLTRPLNALQVATLNRRLAHSTGGDRQATDATRILRPPGTLNHKHDPPRPVVLEDLPATVFDPDELDERLPALEEQEAQAIERALTPRPLRDVSGDPLLAIDPPVYVAQLLGQRPDRSGKVSCPFHSDSTPSLHVYRQAHRGWHCYGCGRGGTIYDLASELWGLDTRGSDFVALRSRLLSELGSPA